MKVIVEDRDVLEVRNTLADSYDILLTFQQAKDLINDNSSIIVNFIECYDYLDTVARENLAHCMIKKVMRHCEKQWRWPTYGDDESYKTEFYKTFKEAAQKEYITLGQTWEKK